MWKQKIRVKASTYVTNQLCMAQLVSNAWPNTHAQINQKILRGLDGVRQSAANTGHKV